MWILKEKCNRVKDVSLDEIARAIECNRVDEGMLLSLVEFCKYFDL